jgi:hypothetical protein
MVGQKLLVIAGMKREREREKKKGKAKEESKPRKIKIVLFAVHYYAELTFCRTHF